MKMPKSPQLAMIVAVSENNVIGNGGDLPWHLPADLKRFKSLTMGHAIIMGRKTFESIGRLLPGRTTVIVTRQSNFQFPGAVIVNSVREAFDAVANDELPFVVGGEEIYRQFLPRVSMIYLTRVHTQVAGDTFLPAIDLANTDVWSLVESQTHNFESTQSASGNPISFTFETYQRLESAIG